MNNKRVLPLFLIMIASLIAAAMTPEARRSFEAFQQRAEAGDPAAQFRLSAILEKGYDSIPTDSARALCLVRRAAQADYPPALNYLGYLYGTGYIVAGDTLQKVNKDSMITCLTKAADLKDPKAISNLAYLLLESNSRDTVSDATLQAKAETVDSTLQAKAYALLGHAYSHGIGVTYDHTEANRCFAKAALLGDPAAAFIIAETLEIFPDAISSLLPPEEAAKMPDAATLKEQAARAGITTSDQATKALLP